MVSSSDQKRRNSFKSEITRLFNAAETDEQKRKIAVRLAHEYATLPGSEPKRVISEIEQEREHET